MNTNSNTHLWIENGHIENTANRAFIGVLFTHKYAWCKGAFYVMFTYRINVLSILIKTKTVTDYIGQKQFLI